MDLLVYATVICFSRAALHRNAFTVKRGFLHSPFPAVPRRSRAAPGKSELSKAKLPVAGSSRVRSQLCHGAMPDDGAAGATAAPPPPRRTVPWEAWARSAWCPGARQALCLSGSTVSSRACSSPLGSPELFQVICERGETFQCPES